MKKSIVLYGFIFIIFFIISVSIVSAFDIYGADLGQGAEQFVEIIQDMLGPIFATLFGSTEFLFEKVLFFVILIVVIFNTAGRLPFLEDKKWALYIITLAVSFLATRFLTEAQWMETILLPYSVLGVALLSFIPFIIFFYFIEKEIESGVARRIAWCLYAIVFIGIWWSRYSVIGQPAWIFIATAVLALIVMLVDRTIQGFFVRAAINQGLSVDTARELATLRKKISDDMKLLEHTSGDQRRNLLKEIARNEKTLKKLAKGPYLAHV